MAEPRLYTMVPLLQAAERSSLDGRHAAIGAYNVNFYAQAAGILEGLMRTNSPGIVQASKGANSFQGGADKIQYMLLKAMADLKYEGPVALHLDHGDEKSAMQCIDDGFSSVMIDGSGNNFTTIDNLYVTQRVTAAAHKKGVSTEGELGQLAGVEEDVVHEKSTYADPVIVPAFFRMTGADALAIAYGTSHGPNKGKTDLVNLAIVGDCYQRLRNDGMNMYHFLVGHGSSTVPQAFVDRINQYGGTLTGTSGVPEPILKQGRYLGVRKFNIDTDLRLAMTAEARQWLAENPDAVHHSPLVGMISGIFDGRIPAIDTKSGKAVEPGKITDPRSWLKPIMDATPAALREDYHETHDDPFIELMGLVRGTVADHVAYLNKEVFNNQGLADKVEGRSIDHLVGVAFPKLDSEPEVIGHA
ncbi:MAG: class II fructose-bisphosphate aldolase [Nanoarchaeota archaeon]|nr:class II fructose-bisphosphate aldolase [Nanoarchaeota archaeon]MBU1704818.1 class II fructose-bisphosphate aldolase [Nanoarchaeota archaeon]